MVDSASRYSPTTMITQRRQSSISHPLPLRRRRHMSVCIKTILRNVQSYIRPCPPSANAAARIAVVRINEKSALNGTETLSPPPSVPIDAGSDCGGEGVDRFPRPRDRLADSMLEAPVDVMSRKLLFDGRK
jgi:hypothetical protein